MGRKRKPLKMKLQGDRCYAVFSHPVRQRTVRVNLGPPEHARANLEALNAIFLNSRYWADPPAEPAAMRAAWLGEASGDVDADAGIDGALESARAEALGRELAAARAENKRLLRELEHWRGRSLREVAPVTLYAAAENWCSRFVGRDPDYTRDACGVVRRFAQVFGAEEQIETLARRERDIAQWLAGLRVGSSRRGQIRTVVLAFLEDAGLQIDRQAIKRPSQSQVRADRGVLRWLTRAEAKRVARELKPYWADVFRVQVGLGLRPDEIVTLHASNFEAGIVTLAPLGKLTLKRGPRSITMPAAVRRIVRRRLRHCPIVFPQPVCYGGRMREGRRPWHRVRYYNDRYRAALQAAGKAAGIPWKLDCRTGRRTCGSILLRSGMSLERVAAILGDTPGMVAEHYARILSHEVDPSAAAI